MAKDTRLQKMLAECGIASRRKAEEMIAAGRVAVNGVRAQIGDKVDVKKDKVTVDGQRVQTVDEKMYIMVHKPRGYLTSMSDDRGRKCVSELVEELPVRLFPIGRLKVRRLRVIGHIATTPAEHTVYGAIAEQLFCAVDHFLHLKSSSLTFLPSEVIFATNSFMVWENFTPSAAETHSTRVRPCSTPM